VSAPSPQADEQQIRQLIATWLSASKAGDTEKVLNLMADDVVFLLPGQPPMRGKAGFAAAQGPMDQFEVDAIGKVEEIKVLGDWAYCWTTLTVVVTPRDGGKAVKRSGNTLSLLQKQRGGWVIVRDANTLTVRE
jgi:uncharacterized protein (TIGR02246 family)